MCARNLTNRGLESRISPTNQYQNTSDLLEKAKDIQRNYTEEKSLVANRYMKMWPAFFNN